MEQIENLLAAVLESPQDQQAAIVAMIAASIFVLAMGVSFFVLGTTNPVRRRLGSLQKTDETGAPRSRHRVDIQTLVGPVSQWIIPQSDKERNAAVQRLIYAGFRSPNALQTFYGMKFVLAASLPAVFLAASAWLPDLSTFQIVLISFLLAAFGMLLPGIALDHIVTRRMTKLRHGFPDALDLLVVCVESGLGLAAAIQRVADELGVSHPELATELALVNAEIRAGVDRSRALRNLTDRTGLEEIRGLVGLLVQTMRFGTSIADTLRVYSDEFRDRRMQKAEEQAAKIGTKLIFPLVLCLFPSFFTVVIGPAVIRLIDVFRVMAAGS